MTTRIHHTTVVGRAWTVVRTRMTQVGKAVTACRSRIGRRALLSGVVASGVHQVLLADLGPRTVLDAGANRGQFALDVAQAVPAAAVVSFEPMAEAAATYERVHRDRPNYRLYRCALGNQTRESVLHVSASDDSSSLLAIGRRQSSSFPNTHEARREPVQVRRLDDLVELGPGDMPVMLKIDVQGFELEVLEGASSTLSAVRWVYVECSFVELYEGQPLAAEVVEALHSSGFALAGIGDVTSVRGRVLQADLLFERRGSSAGSSSD